MFKLLPIVNPFFLAFLISPIVLIILKQTGKISVSLMLIILIYMIAGWFLVNSTIWFHYEMVKILINNTQNPPQELIDHLTEDGAKRAFEFFFGWLYSFVYFIFCYVLIWVGRKVIYLVYRVFFKHGL